MSEEISGTSDINRDEREGENIFYSDKYCKATSTEIEIFTYYFPSGSSITIPYAHIEAIGIILSPLYRVWGTGIFSHWFAFDMTRFGRATPPKGYVYVRVRGDGITKCFTADHVDQLIRSIIHRSPQIIRQDVRLSIAGASPVQAQR